MLRGGDSCRLSREVEEANAREAEAMEKLQQVTLAAEEQMSRGDAAAQRANAAATESSALNTKMEALVAERASAWAELDALRAQLQEAGQQLETAVQGEGGRLSVMTCPVIDATAVIR